MNRTVFLPQDMDATGKDFLRERGYQIRLASGHDEATLRREIGDSDALILRTATITRTIMEATPHLRIIAKHGVGVDNIDLDVASELGIWVTNAPLSNANTVAEHTIGMILALARHILPLDRALRHGDYDLRDRLTGSDVAEKTLGILGLGRIAERVAKKAALGLDMKVIGHDPRAKFEATWLERVPTRDEVLCRADFLSLHLPSRTETRHSVGRDELAMMKPTSFLINTARGDIVDETALVEALQNRQIAGAALDVFADEPPTPQNPLFALQNVIVTPHSAALTYEARERMALQAAQSVHEVLSGYRPSWPVNMPHSRR